MTIAVSQRVVIDPKTGERRDALDQRWPQFLEQAGLFGEMRLTLSHGVNLFTNAAL